MPASYAPLPTSRFAHEAADRELEAAFDSDDEGQDSSEFTPLTHRITHSSAEHPQDARREPPSSAIPGSYDFERERDYDYDFPPPGSPPGPSALALPNSFGNSNGFVPTEPVLRSTGPRPSLFRRTVGALLPQHYVQVPTDAPNTRVIGGGTENDGVFANVSAKPSRPVTVVDANGEVHLVPEEVQKETPPTYAEAQADAVPPYWETTVHAPASLDPNSYMIVEDLPSGPILSFFATAFVSFFFQFAGFVLTYLLHTTHAAKYGSRAGLGATLIQFGLIQYGGSYSRWNGMPIEADPATPTNATVSASLTSLTPTVSGAPPTPTESSLPYTWWGNGTYQNSPYDELDFGISSRDWIALMLMTIGWFLLLSSSVGFYRVKRWEASIRAASMPPEVLTPEQRERDAQVRRNIELAFGFGHFDEDDESPLSTADENAQRRDDEQAHLARALEVAGLI